MAGRFFLVILLLFYFAILPGFTHSLRERPVQVKLGYVPHPQMIRLLAGEFAPVVAEMTMLKVIFYFGTLVDKWSQQIQVPAEYPNMYRALVTASEVDPYNQDVYYFAQATFTWELGRIHDVNQLLEKGMRFRTQDPWLPFYVGFNYAYFLKDYERAAQYMEISAKLSGDPLRVGLASRYFYEAKRTDLGLAFLNMSIAREKNLAVKKSYEERREALLAVAAIEKASGEYLKETGRKADTLEQLIDAGFLSAVPHDPYGGKFFLGENGQVRSTSNFAHR